MIFLDKIQALRETYDISECDVQDTVILYGINNAINFCDHIIFSPMSAEVMQILIDSYKRTIPQELLTIYRTMNGCNLFYKNSWLDRAKIFFPFSSISIYGVPLTNTRDRYEPYNISLEDTDSPKGTPMNWLKFGSYSRPDTFPDWDDLYVDTDTGKVHAQIHNDPQCTVTESWESIDECLCAIFDLSSKHFCR